VIVGNITNHKSLLYFFNMTVKPAQLVTSIKQSPVLKGHLACLIIENLI